MADISSVPRRGLPKEWAEEMGLSSTTAASDPTANTNTSMSTDHTNLGSSLAHDSVPGSGTGTGTGSAIDIGSGMETPPSDHPHSQFQLKTTQQLANPQQAHARSLVVQSLSNNDRNLNSADNNGGSSSNEHTPPAMVPAPGGRALNTLGGAHFDQQLDGFLDRFQEEIFRARSLKDDLDRLSPLAAAAAAAKPGMVMMMPAATDSPGERGTVGLDDKYRIKKEEFKRKMEQIRSLFDTEGEDFLNSLEKRNPQLIMATCGANTIELAQGIDRLETAVREEETKRHQHQQQPQQYNEAEVVTPERQPLQQQKPSSKSIPVSSTDITSVAFMQGQQEVQHRVAAPPIATSVASPVLMATGSPLQGEGSLMSIASPGNNGNSGSALFTSKSTMMMNNNNGNTNANLNNVNSNLSPLSPRTTGLLTANGLVVGHTPLNNLSSDETLQLMQSDIQSLKLELMRLQRSKVTNGGYVANSTPHSLPTRSIDSSHDNSSTLNHNHAQNSPVPSGSYSTAGSPNGATSLYNLHQHHQNNHADISLSPDSRNGNGNGAMLVAQDFSPSVNTSSEELDHQNHNLHQHQQQPQYSQYHLHHHHVHQPDEKDKTHDNVVHHPHTNPPQLPIQPQHDTNVTAATTNTNTTSNSNPQPHGHLHDRDRDRDRDRDQQQLPPSLLANNNVNVVRVTGRATGNGYVPPTYVSHLEQMKSRIEALEKKPLSRRAKSVARLGRTHTMGSMYDHGHSHVHTHSIRPLHHHHHLHRQSHGSGSESSPSQGGTSLSPSSSTSATSPNSQLHHQPFPPYRRTQRASSQLTIQQHQQLHSHGHSNVHSHIPHHQSMFHIQQSSLSSTTVPSASSTLNHRHQSQSQLNQQTQQQQLSPPPSSTDIVHHVPQQQYSPQHHQRSPQHQQQQHSQVVVVQTDENQNPNATMMTTPPRNLRHSATKRRSISSSSPLAPISSNTVQNYHNANNNSQHTVNSVIYPQNSVRRSPPLRSSPIRLMTTRLSPPVTATSGAPINSVDNGGNNNSSNNHRFTIATSSPTSTPSPKRPLFVQHQQQQHVTAMGAALHRHSPNSSSSPSSSSPTRMTTTNAPNATHSPGVAHPSKNLCAAGSGPTAQNTFTGAGISASGGGEGSSAGTSPARLFFDAPEEMLSRPQSQAAARDIQRYSLKVARRFIPVGGHNNAKNLADRMLSDSGASSNVGLSTIAHGGANGNGMSVMGGVGMNGNDGTGGMVGGGVEPRSKSAVTPSSKTTATGITSGPGGGIEQPMMSHTLSDIGTTNTNSSAVVGGTAAGAASVMAPVGGVQQVSGAGPGAMMMDANKTTTGTSAALAVATIDSSASGGAGTVSSNGRVVEEIEGDMWVRKGVVWKRWRRRYASIVSHQFFGRVMCLFSYDSNGGVISTRSQIVVLNQSLCKPLKETVDIGGQIKHVFVLRTSAKEYFFAAESDDVRRAWIRELRDAAKLDSSRMTQTSTSGAGGSGGSNNRAGGVLNANIIVGKGGRSMAFRRR